MTTDRSAAGAEEFGHESKLAYCANVLIENRNGLVVDTELVMRAARRARRCRRDVRADRRRQRVTVGADKGYDTRGLSATCGAQRHTARL